jgi:hypothetical protein
VRRRAARTVVRGEGGTSPSHAVSMEPLILDTDSILGPAMEGGS